MDIRDGTAIMPQYAGRPVSTVCNSSVCRKGKRCHMPTVWASQAAPGPWWKFFHHNTMSGGRAFKNFSASPYRTAPV